MKLAGGFGGGGNKVAVCISHGMLISPSRHVRRHWMAGYFSPAGFPVEPEDLSAAVSMPPWRRRWKESRRTRHASRSRTPRIRAT
jgi:hypothetical protein